MPVACERCFKQRISPVLDKIRRAFRADEPARFRSTWHRFCRGDTNEKNRDARVCGPQRKLAGGHEIERFWLPPNFEHHYTKRFARERIESGTQRFGAVSRFHEQEQVRIYAEIEQTLRGQLSALPRGEILSHP
jgi:hypothetical protein